MSELQELLEEFLHRRQENKEIRDRVDDLMWAMHSLLLQLIEKEQSNAQR